MNMSNQIPLISFSTFAAEAKVSKKKTAKEKRADKVRKLESNPDHWKFLEDKSYGNPAELNYKARETYTDLFLDRLREFLSTKNEMTPLETVQRLYVIYDETLGQRK